MPLNTSTALPVTEEPDNGLEGSKIDVHPSVPRRFREMSFDIEDSFYRSRLPRATHWSIAWSDLMMTMFVLFLSMFVYQAAHQDFLVHKSPEIIGGSTADAIEADGIQDLIVPIVPIRQTAPLISSGKLLTVEKVPFNDSDVDQAFQEETPKKTIQKEMAEKPAVTEDIPTNSTSPKSDIVTIEKNVPVIKEIETSEKNHDNRAQQPPPAEQQVQEKIKTKTDIFSEIYDVSKQTLDENKLDKFASIEVVPDKTMRIILTGDLLFEVGQADLSRQAKESLLKIAPIIKKTPYMINVIGHTDNSPMHSAKFASNWELSVMRASSVTRFLLAATHSNPQQFIVSGYGSHRPIQTNDTSEHRAANRRVEIIISKRLAPAIQATSKNLL